MSKSSVKLAVVLALVYGVALYGAITVAGEYVSFSGPGFFAVTTVLFAAFATLVIRRARR